MKSHRLEPRRELPPPPSLPTHLFLPLLQPRQQLGHPHRRPCRCSSARSAVYVQCQPGDNVATWVQGGRELCGGQANVAGHPAIGRGLPEPGIALQRSSALMGAARRAACTLISRTIAASLVQVCVFTVFCSPLYEAPSAVWLGHALVMTVEDIEDLFEGDGGQTRPQMQSLVQSRRVGQPQQDQAGADGTSSGGRGRLPGAQRVWLKVFGCSHNVSDGEVMAGALDSYGYRWECVRY